MFVEGNLAMRLQPGRWAESSQASAPGGSLGVTHHHPRGPTALLHRLLPALSSRRGCVFTLYLFTFPVHSKDHWILNKCMSRPSCGFKLGRKEAEATAFRLRRVAALPE